MAEHKEAQVRHRPHGIEQGNKARHKTALREGQGPRGQEGCRKAQANRSWQAQEALPEPVSVQAQVQRGEHKEPGSGRAVQAAAPPGHGQGHKGKDLAGQDERAGQEEQARQQQKSVEEADKPVPGAAALPCGTWRPVSPRSLSPCSGDKRPVPARIEAVVQDKQGQKEAACLAVPQEPPGERIAHEKEQEQGHGSVHGPLEPLPAPHSLIPLAPSQASSSASSLRPPE